MFILQLGKSLAEKISNDNSPIIEKKAKVIDKRTSTSRRHHNSGNGHMHSHSVTSNYMTFEMEDGERMEFLIKGKEFGLIVVGDSGALKYQGTRFLEFSRDK